VGNPSSLRGTKHTHFATVSSGRPEREVLIPGGLRNARSRAIFCDPGQSLMSGLCGDVVPLASDLGENVGNRWDRPDQVAHLTLAAIQHADHHPALHDGQVSPSCLPSGRTAAIDVPFDSQREQDSVPHPLTSHSLVETLSMLRRSHARKR